MTPTPLPRWLAAGVLALSPLLAAAQGAGEPVLELKFGSFFRQPVGPRGLEFSDVLRAAAGREVRLVGYMVAQEEPAAGRFLLTPRPVRISEHADGDADDLPPATVTVLLDEAQRERIVAHRDGLVVLTGQLSVGRQEGADGRVSWLRLQLPPQALAGSAATAPNNPPPLPTEAR
ncbi:MAG: hypothetical protein ABW005_08955 [Burkholderiaceae bacterium]